MDSGSTEPLPPIVDGEETFLVRELVDSRRRGPNIQYLVDWECYGPEESLWENTEDILDPNLISDFHRSHPDKPVPRPRGHPRKNSSCVGSRSRGGSVTDVSANTPGVQTSHSLEL